jgi:LuxR family transcriptional regulator, quorum-sensing system regulator BjaR1
MLENMAFETVENLKTCRSFDDVTSTFSKACGFLGAKAFIICDIPAHAPPGRNEVYASGWDSAWEDRYASKNYGRWDPVPNHVYRTVNPFYWHEVGQSERKDSTGYHIMNEARYEFGMEDGYCIPIHGLHGTAGLVSVASDLQNWKLGEREDAILHLIGIYAFEAVRKLRQGLNSPGGGGPKLSPRELECTRWLAEGKTTWEMAKIMGIAQETVREYIKSASRKMETCTQAHLVARAHRLNLIH